MTVRPRTILAIQAVPSSQAGVSFSATAALQMQGSRIRLDVREHKRILSRNTYELGRLSRAEALVMFRMITLYDVTESENWLGTLPPFVLRNTGASRQTI